MQPTGPVEELTGDDPIETNKLIRRRPWSAVHL
jgi:hypothetical protein